MDHQIQRQQVHCDDSDGPAGIRHPGKILCGQLLFDGQDGTQRHLHSADREGELHDRVLRVIGRQAEVLRIGRYAREYQCLQERYLHGTFHAEPGPCQRSPYDRRDGQYIEEECHIGDLFLFDVQRDGSKQDQDTVAAVPDDHREEQREEQEEPQ